MRLRYLILFIIIAVVLPVASAGSVIVSNGYEVSVIHSSSDLKLSATTFNGLTDKMNPYNSSAQLSYSTSSPGSINISKAVDFKNGGSYELNLTATLSQYSGMKYVTSVTVYGYLPDKGYCRVIVANFSNGTAISEKSSNITIASNSLVTIGELFTVSSEFTEQGQAQFSITLALPFNTLNGSSFVGSSYSLTTTVNYVTLY